MNELEEEELLDWEQRKSLRKTISGIDNFCGGLHEVVDQVTEVFGGLLMWVHGLGWAMSDALVRRGKIIRPIIRKESPHLIRILKMEDE